MLDTDEDWRISVMRNIQDFTYPNFIAPSILEKFALTWAEDPVHFYSLMFCTIWTVKSDLRSNMLLQYWHGVVLALFLPKSQTSVSEVQLIIALYEKIHLCQGKMIELFLNVFHCLFNVLNMHVVQFHEVLHAVMARIQFSACWAIPWFIKTNFVLKW